MAVITVAAGQDRQEELMMTPQTYKCSPDSDCGVDMSTADPEADAMPHKEAPFPELASLSPDQLRDRMNFGRGGQRVSSDRLFPNTGLDDNQQIPYEAPDHIPAMRRPCNLDKVLELLASIVQEYRDEAAKVANETLFQLQSIIMSKATLIHDQL